MLQEFGMIFSEEFRSAVAHHWFNAFSFFQRIEPRFKHLQMVDSGHSFLCIAHSILLCNIEIAQYTVEGLRCQRVWFSWELESIFKIIVCN